ncbi:MAG TPA: hypothetical protein VKB87_06325, partial [Myxococcaceae bacterium]|nr:hypothetical protein [Myxococcaceae bacterium]
NAGDDLVLYVDGWPHRVFLGFAIGCSNLVARPAFLSPMQPDGYGGYLPWNYQPFRAYESDLDYMCFKVTDPGDYVSKWFCGAGKLGEGVVGTASVTSPSSGSYSPRTFVVNNVTWGGNVWDHHWEFGGWGVISNRIDPAYQTGYAQDTAWNLNPNDYHGDGTSKALDWIAAVTVKTSTNGNGVHITPYNTRSVQNYACQTNYPTSSTFPSTCTLRAGNTDPRYLASLNPSELNQGEAETRSCGADTTNCFNYSSYMDTLSNGLIGTGSGSTFPGLPDLKVSNFYVNAANAGTCSWQKDWGLSGASPSSYANIINWSASPYNGTKTSSYTLPRSSYKVAVNIGNLENSRCPTWQLCTSGRSGTHRTVVIPYDSYWNQLPATAVQFLNSPYTACPTQAKGEACKQLLCGSATQLNTADGSYLNWYTCSGPYCDTYYGSWQLTCQNQKNCKIAMADQDTFVLAMPLALQAQIDADGWSNDLGWATINAGQ